MQAGRTHIPDRPAHPWLSTVHVAHVEGPSTALLSEVVAGVLERFARRGHHVQPVPDSTTDVILTTARFNEPVDWRQAPLFYARRRFSLGRTPTVYTLVHALSGEFQQTLARIEQAASLDSADPRLLSFPGLGPQAYMVLHEQARRGGPVLALERAVQAQAKSFRIILVVGDDRPLVAYHFDLVGAHPATVADGEGTEAFYDDIVLRIVTTMSTHEVAEHVVVGEPEPRYVWERLTTPSAMIVASQELGRRGFFTEPVYIADLVPVPAVPGAVASQYSEGCFATWDPDLRALIATVTGSIRPVHKGSITEHDLAVIVGVREDGRGALVRHVEGNRNDPPSSEAVEMMDMDSTLPRVVLPPGAIGGVAGDSSGPQDRPSAGHSAVAENLQHEVPVVRSKLHGHRGIASYDPERVEYVPLDPPYYYYLVSCATEAQAQGVKAAFSRSRALQNPDDPRQVVFTVLPGHGAIIAEKWVPGKAPFQTIWEYMDAGYLQISGQVPQGLMWYELAPDGKMVLRMR